jgi:mycothiol system anti-sigma-R factor
MMNPMNCEEALQLLPAYSDGELDLSRVLALEQHIDGCADCAESMRTQRAMRQAVRSITYHRAPAALRARLGAQLPLAVEAPVSAAAPLQRAQPRRLRDWARWAMPIAASLALALGLNVMQATQLGQDALRDELIAGHVRSLQGAHLSDVVSSDQHTVKPWFNGKLDYAPPVRDLAQQNFPLLGGRLDYIAHRQVAALIYGSHKHYINLYIWPARDGELAPTGLSSEGYSLVHWRHDGMEYWAISDLNAQDLRHFADLQSSAGTDKTANAPNN